MNIGARHLHLPVGCFPFKDLFKAFNLIDILPTNLAPTWRNGRRGSEAVASRLDRFLISESFFTSSAFPSPGPALPFFSDHTPIILSINLIVRLKPFPFKYNQHWADSSEYSALVSQVWNDPRFQQDTNPQSRLVWKLSLLKAQTKHWINIKKAEAASTLNRIDLEILSLLQNSSISALSPEDETTLKALEHNKNSILLDDEKCWRLRSRMTWLKWGDSNSKFFHKVANINRNKKLIWSMEHWFGGDYPWTGGAQACSGHTF
jgi:hypothetical protein